MRHNQLKYQVIYELQDRYKNKVGKSSLESRQL